MTQQKNVAGCLPQRMDSSSTQTYDSFKLTELKTRKVPTALKKNESVCDMHTQWHTAPGNRDITHS